ncbi:MAG: divalent-cation tolerance protein CutA [Rhodobacteraceae bacterium]|nr:divalent-cation tolerance protein CutA [Paracoccaceae bacterium]
MTGLVRLRCGCPDAETALGIGRQAVEQRLAAAVNVAGPVTSIYRWKGAVHETTEFVLEATTLVGKIEEFCTLIHALHPYDTPSITWWSVARDQVAADWVRAEIG